MNRKIKSVGKFILIVAFVCIFMLSGYKLYSYFKECRELNESYEDAQNLVQINTTPDETIAPTEPTNITEDATQTGPTDEYEELKINIDIDWKELESQSEDVVGWLYIPDTNINYPIVHGDNDYYLNHDYKGNWNSGGSIFLEEQATLESQNMIIYGHHMKADTMFHRLPNYADQEYTDSHKYIYIATKNETRLYQVFSVVYTQGNSDTYTLNFEDADTFVEYVEKAIENSVVEADIREIVGNDTIISLSTCTGRTKIERLVVHAVFLTEYYNIATSNFVS